VKKMAAERMRLPSSQVRIENERLNGAKHRQIRGYFAAMTTLEGAFETAKATPMAPQRISVFNRFMSLKRL
jgi:hypothetical protein